jgi:hypothetical protein
MKNIRREIAIWVQFGALIFIWIAILYLSGIDFQINWEALKKIPEVVTIYSVLYLLFTRWAWRLRIFQHWLVPYPDLQGTWGGILESTWVDPRTGKRVEPIPILITIRQSFATISCAMYSGESSSYSSAAQINADEEGGSLHLSYAYTNRPKAAVRDRSEIHDGAASLEIIAKPHRTLEGEYWTSRKTTGDIRVTFKSRDLASGFLATPISHE